MKTPRGSVIIIIELLILAVLSVPVILKTCTPFFIVTTHSMHPVIPAGSLIFIKNNNNHETRSGDIIVFFDPLIKRIIVHRAVAVHDGYAVTKGDNNAFVDFFQPYRPFILGTVIGIVPRFHSIALLMMILIILFICVFFLMRLRKKITS